MPDSLHPPYESGALTTPRTLQKWLDVNAQNGPLKRTQRFITIPAFDIDVNWLGYSQIVGQFSYEAPNNFSLKNFTRPDSPNCTVCISYVESDHTVRRYRLWSSEDEVIYFQIPEYDGQLILKNFTIEIWSTDTTSVTLDNDLTIYTGVRGSIDYRYGVDTILITDDGLCTGQANINGALSPSLTDLTQWFDSTFGINASGINIINWTDRIVASTLSVLGGGTQPTIHDIGGTPTYLNFGTTSDIGRLIGPGGTVITWMALIRLNASVVGRVLLLNFTPANFQLEQENLSLRLTIQGNSLDSPNLELNTWYVVEMHCASAGMQFNVWNAETNEVVCALTGPATGLMGDTSIIIGKNVTGGDFRIAQALAYITISPTFEQRMQTISYLFSRVVTNPLSLPLTWGACAQPTLN